MKWHVSVLEEGDVFVFGCVWLCLVVLVCVVFVVLLVASVLASMRWLLCGGDGSEEKRLQKKSLVKNFSTTVLNQCEKLKPHQITVIPVLFF